MFSVQKHIWKLVLYVGELNWKEGLEIKLLLFHKSILYNVIQKEFSKLKNIMVCKTLIKILKLNCLKVTK